MIYRLAGSHFTLHLITLSILIGIIGIMTEQFEFLITNHHLNFIPAEVGMEDNISVLVASLGIFLESRRWLLDRIYPNTIPESIDQFDRYSQGIGVFLILIAIAIESADLFFLALNKWNIESAGLKYLEISVLSAANLLALTIVTLFGLRSIRE